MLVCCRFVEDFAAKLGDHGLVVGASRVSSHCTPLLAGCSQGGWDREPGCMGKSWVGQWLVVGVASPAGSPT